MTWVQVEGTNGGDNRRGKGSRCRHAARGAETSNGIWRVASVGDIQVDRAPIRERIWGAGVTEI